MTLVGNRRSAVTLTGLFKASFLFVLTVLLSGCSAAPENTRWQGAVMGTRYHITIASDQPVPSSLEAEVAALLAGLDARFTTYSDHSELMALNRQPLNQPLALSAELYTVLSAAAEIYQLSDGAFDPSVGPLVELWGFGRRQASDAVPADAAIAAAKEQVGFSRLELLTGQRAQRTAPVTIDLSAIAKGYAVDRVAELLERNALNDYMVEVGGELRLGGRNSRGEPWRIAIESPLVIGEVERLLTVSDVAVATSGDYHNYFEVDGVRYSHTLNPHTGWPVPRSLVSVTVVSDSSARADALATALSVVGAQRSLALAEQHGLAVYLLSLQEGELVAQQSAAMAQYLSPVQD